MPPRSQPSERQRRLGAELKKLRLRAGLSGDQAANLIDADRGRVSNIEAGRVDVPRNGLHKLLRAYGCAEGALFEGLMTMAQDRGKGWWDGYRNTMGRPALDLAELEARASGISTHELLVIPGMFQTADYARAVCETADEDDAAAIDRYVCFRLDRQRLLAGEAAAPYHAVIHEGALHTRVGSPQVMRKQLLRLIEVARAPHITVQVFPFEAGAFSAFSRTFAIFGGPTPELDTVRLEQPVTSAVLHDPVHLDRYARLFARLSELALPPIDPDSSPESHEDRDSLSLIQHLMYAL
ncbi:helix-turn-helix domain-containing protein [Streptomyces sp. H27-D2]|uniref:helix-turn-helix domain-containing protein n=1 Tax=Streptomyces sp. H27-D2 TaxID=3046304 RepID=UPI002DB8EC27|nr:helix-turn-helix transcriptional regulator [Streptomyces sp. H27-D2]MEC4015709.1 helix-turn-helix transcriptional regulator [Streptomyces sp. H27-D2]